MDLGCKPCDPNKQTSQIKIYILGNGMNSTLNNLNLASMDSNMYFYVKDTRKFKNHFK